MKDYKLLAVKYLQKNKRRTATTVFGVMLSVIVLYTIMNLAYCYVLTQREKIRSQEDYEIILLTDSTAIANQVVLKDYVVSVDTGSWYHPYLRKVLEKPVLFIKVDKPEKAYDYKDELEHLYGVEALCNEELLGLYMRGDASLELILVLTLILFAYIFAIFGVGIIRNSIQLTLLEQIKDFGILRCIGATKLQFCTFVYLMGAILEIAGIMLGIVLGYPICLVIGKHFRLYMGFYMWVVLIIVLIFLFDLLFVMRENCKSINQIPPIEAAHGQIRIRKEKLKIRRSKLIRRLFGIEGEYAFKSLLRYPERFYKSVGAISFGIAAFVTISCINSTVYTQTGAFEKQYGYYQVYCFAIGRDIFTTEQLQEKAPDIETLERLKQDSGVEVAKKLYCSSVYMTNADEIMKHIQQDYKSKAVGGEIYDESNLNKHEEDSEDAIALSTINLFGMDEEDLARIDQKKVDGTLQVSENGIILFNKVYTLLKEDNINCMAQAYDDFEVTNYKVGDTVQVVNPIALRNRYQEKLPQYMKFLDETEENNEQKHLNKEENEGVVYSELIQECVKELTKEGETQTFTIEAIVNDYNSIMPTVCSFALPLSKYTTFEGRDESVYSGLKLHINFRKSVKELSDYINNIDMYESEDYALSPLSYFLSMSELWRKISFYILLVVVFIVVMSCLNIINTTASNLYLRKRELAQLRVIGISKNRLYYVVILEGFITLFIAAFLGLLMGYGIGRGLMIVFTMLLGWTFHFSWSVFLFCIVIFGIVLCGTDYFLIKEMTQELADDLKANVD